MGLQAGEAVRNSSQGLDAKKPAVADRHLCVVLTGNDVICPGVSTVPQDSDFRVCLRNGIHMTVRLRDRQAMMAAFVFTHRASCGVRALRGRAVENVTRRRYPFVPGIEMKNSILRCFLPRD